MSTDSSVINMGEPSAGFVEALKTRLETDVIPDLPAVVADVVRAGHISWNLGSLDRHGGLPRVAVTSELWCREVLLEGCSHAASCPREFGEDVIRVARSRGPGVRIKDVAEDFGISESCLNKLAGAYRRRHDLEHWGRGDLADVDARIAESEAQLPPELIDEARRLGEPSDHPGPGLF